MSPYAQLGSMGVVYEAHDPQIDRRVALKTLRQDKMSSEEFVQRFLKEARAIGRLSHPNIVAVYDVGRDNDTIYIAMEYLEGEPMDKVISSGKTPFEQVVSFCVQVAETLAYAHEKGIIHRDIKPSNIIIDKRGHIKITDFGIARFEDPQASEATQAGVILGTPAYMSPEQVKGQPVDRRSDLFSLGVILYELATNKRPFSGENMVATFHSILEDTPPKPTRENGEIPEQLSSVVMRSLEKEPEKRFQDGNEMATSLQTCLKTTTEPPSQPHSSQEFTHIKDYESTKPRVIGPALFVSIILAVLTVAGVSLFIRGDKTTQVEQIEAEKVEQPPLPQTVLRVDSIPQNAQVFVNNDFVGETPLKASVNLGKHEIRLSLFNYYDWEAQIELVDQKETPLYVRLIKMDP